ncbi:MAG: 7-cyano-7-deazaguanine synthase [Acidobacteriota bacterium]|nr:7-cyano-7-deazaguanine synthase [Acidobacteriota bacterium]
MTRPVVLFSAGLDSAVLLVQTAQRYGRAQPVYVRSGLAWEIDEQAYAQRFLAALPPASGVGDLVVLNVDMRDVYPASHWAIRGEAPAFDTHDEDVYLEGRNLVLLSKTAVFAARTGSDRIVIGPLAGNPFPDARPEFFDTMSRALSLGLDAALEIEAPFLALHKADVIRLGTELGVRFELTLSCMQPAGDPARHCGRCSKCRERRDAFRAARISDPASSAPR